MVALGHVDHGQPSRTRERVQRGALKLMMSASSIARSASAEESSAASAAPSLSVPSEGAADVAPPVAAAAPPVPVRAWYGLGLADSKLLVPPPEVPPLLEPASPSEPSVVLPAWPSVWPCRVHWRILPPDS